MQEFLITVAVSITLRHHDQTWIEFLISGLEQVKFEEFDAVTMNSNCARAFQLFARKPTT